MDKLIRQDLKVCLVAGFIAGILSLPTLHNLGLPINFQSSILVILSFIGFIFLGYFIAYWISHFWPTALQFVKFGISGGLSAMVDFGILNILIFVFQIASGFWYVVFKSVSVLFGIINSYLWNKHWTFKAGTTGVETKEFLKFFLFASFSFLLNVAIASFIVNFIGAPTGTSEKVWANVGAATAAIIVLLWNYTWMRFIVFKR